MTAVSATARVSPHVTLPSAIAGSRLGVHTPPVLPDISDITALLMQMKMKDRDHAAQRAEAGVAVGDVVREAASTRAREALEQAKAKDEDSGFWAKVGSTLSTVATVAAVVAAAASVVCTGGASAPAILALAGTLLSASSPLIAKAAGDDAGKVAMYGGIALSLGSAGWSVFGKTAAVEGAKLAASSPTVRSIGAGTVILARGTEGGARIAEGYGKVREKHAGAEAEHARADALEARTQVRRSQAQVEALVDCMRELDASVSRAMQTIAQVAVDHEQSRQQLVTNLRRV